MALRKWLGDDANYQDFTTQSLWSVPGWPSTGDTLIIDKGSSVIHGYDTRSAPIYLGSHDAQDIARLQLDNATSTIMLGINPTELAPDMFLPRYSFVNASYTSSVQVEGTGGRVGADYLWMHAGPGVTLTTDMYLQNGGSTVIYGGGLVNNTATTLIKTSLDIENAVVGDGLYNVGNAGRLEFASYVGADESIFTTAESAYVQIDQASMFYGNLVAQQMGEFNFKGINVSTADFVPSTGMVRAFDEHGTMVSAFRFDDRTAQDFSLIKEWNGELTIRDSQVGLLGNEQLLGTY